MPKKTSNTEPAIGEFLTLIPSFSYKPFFAQPQKL